MNGDQYCPTRQFSNPAEYQKYATAGHIQNFGTYTDRQQTVPKAILGIELAFFSEGFSHASLSGLKVFN